MFRTIKNIARHGLSVNVPLTFTYSDGSESIQCGHFDIERTDDFTIHCNECGATAFAPR